MYLHAYGYTMRGERPLQRPQPVAADTRTAQRAADRVPNPVFTIPDPHWRLGMSEYVGGWDPTAGCWVVIRHNGVRTTYERRLATKRDLYGFRNWLLRQQQEAR